MDYIAHIRTSDGTQQKVEEHLLNVKTMTEKLGEKVDIKHLAGLAGVLHDLGKFTIEFQNYILQAVQNPHDYSTRGSVDHSTAGGRWLYELYHNEESFNKYEFLVAEVVGNAIISHHSYLHDFLNPELKSDYLRRVKEKEAKELENLDDIKEIFFEKVMSKGELTLYVTRAVQEMKCFLERVSDEEMTVETKLMFLSKLIFSMLIDADRTDSRMFEDNIKEEKPVYVTKLFRQYYDRLMIQLNEFPKEGHINQLRSSMSEQCDAFAKSASGIYTLSVPTGGGKTLASLRYALQHALVHGKKRIIYVVPYTTIIEQNAMEVREKLADVENILEHHSNVVEDYNNSEEDSVDFGIKKKLKLAKDNWDSPIIFTTMVQFLNVFYAKSTRDIRRLHNLLESVIVFDEVQKVPLHCTSLFNLAGNFLKMYGKSSILLCTATQPTLGKVEHYQLTVDEEIIKEVDKVIDAFKRVEVIDKISEITNSENLCEFIQELLSEKKTLLVILNTKGAVRELFDKLRERSLEIPVYHLNTSMCAAHRKNILEEVKERLEDEEPVICLSTQLIEAGVDISFNCVIRSLAGLDSIAQAAGRCNRHGKDKVQQVYVINNKDENLDKLEEIEVGKEIARKMFFDLRHNSKEHGGHILSRVAIECYFKRYYKKWEGKENLNYPIKALNYKGMVQILTHNQEYVDAYIKAHHQHIRLCLRSSYQTAARYFQAIKDETTTVVVPYEDKFKRKRDGKDLIADLNSANSVESFSDWLKEAQLYTISIYSHTLKVLEKNGGVIKYKDKNIFVLSDAAYNEHLGLDIEVESLDSMFI